MELKFDYIIHSIMKLCSNSNELNRYTVNLNDNNLVNHLDLFPPQLKNRT